MTQGENRVALTHHLECQLDRLESQPTNPGRERSIRDLKKRLDDLKQQPQ